MFNIKEKISQSHTLPSEFYRSETIFEQVKEKILASSWLWVGDNTMVSEKGQQQPITLLEGVLDEPVLFTRDKKNDVHCLSNVCTHRGKIIVEQAQKGRMLQCGYHGRCFGLDGNFKRQVAFEEAENFPSIDDNLPKIPFAEWLNMFFVSCNPKVSFEEMVAPIMERVSYLPLNEMEFDASTSTDYFVESNWALYCDNYLEGLHVPFVHPELNEAIDFGDYDYEIFDYCNLQLGIADENEERYFTPPKGHPDFGKKVYAWYFWLFPNLMLNFYPFGLSLNVVTPLSHKRTKVSFRTYKFKNTNLSPEHYCIHATEMQDEAVVESVQKGVQSRFYKQGRFSPTHEKAVHHFHTLIQKYMSKI